MCSLLTSWYQLAQELIAFYSPLHAAVVSECFEELENCVEMAAAQSVQQQQQPSPSGEQTTHKAEEAISHYQDQQQQQQHQIQLGEVRTAKMETVSELDLAPILPSERVLRGISLLLQIKIHFDLMSDWIRFRLFSCGECSDLH
jgi:hypothetical protein